MVHVEIIKIPFVAGRHHCRLAGGDGERDLRDPVHQQGVDGFNSTTYRAGGCRFGVRI